MATNNKLCGYVKTEAQFNALKVSADAENTTYYQNGAVLFGEPDIRFEQIVFIEETGKVWTHGQYYLDEESTEQDPRPWETPHMYWKGSLPTTKAEGALQGALRYVSEKEDVTFYATLKVQGDSSASYPKKNFTISLYTDDTYAEKLNYEFKDWGARSCFVMKSHWIDHSHIRNITAAKVWKQMMESRDDYDTLPTELKDAVGHGATQGFSFRFWANGLYYGLYEMVLPKKIIFGQSKSNASHSLLNSDWNNKKVCTFDTLTPNLTDGWTEELQDAIPEAANTSFCNLIKLIAGNDNDEILANLSTYVDVMSVIDYDIFARIFVLRDNLAKNQIFATYDGTKWYEGAWDMDASMGCPPTTSTAFCQPNIIFQEEYEAYRAYQLSNRLYDKVEELYMQELKDRYAYLRSTVLDIKNIISIYEQYNDCVYQWLDEDYASTTGDGSFTTIPFKTQNNIQQIRSFLKARLEYMDDIISKLSHKVAEPVVTIGFTKVTIECETSSAVIHYTLDGTTPTESSPVYTTSFAYNEGDLLKVYAVKPNYEDSPVKEQLLTNPYRIVDNVVQNGYAHFVSDYVPNANTAVEYKIAFNEGSHSYAWGGHYLSGQSNTGTGIYYAPLFRTRGAADGSMEMFCRIGSTEYTYHYDSYELQTPYIVSLANNTITVNGDDIVTSVTTTHSCTSPLGVMGLARDGVINSSNNNAKNNTVWYLKIRENGELIREYIPVLNTVTNQYGLLETKTETFNHGDEGGFNGPAGNHVTGVSLNKTNLNLYETMTREVKLTATITPDNADNKNVTWSSTNTDVVTVDDGTLTIVGPGTAGVIVTTEDGGYIARCNVTIEAEETYDYKFEELTLDGAGGEVWLLDPTAPDTEANRLCIFDDEHQNWTLFGYAKQSLNPNSDTNATLYQVVVNASPWSGVRVDADNGNYPSASNTYSPLIPRFLAGSDHFINTSTGDDCGSSKPLITPPEMEHPVSFSRNGDVYKYSIDGVNWITLNNLNATQLTRLKTAPITVGFDFKRSGGTMTTTKYRKLKTDSPACVALKFESEYPYYTLYDKYDGTVTELVD